MAMKLSLRAKKILKWVGYPAFFLVCFLVSLVWTFPFERIQDKLQSHFREQYEVSLTMDSISGTIPFGIKARNVVLMSEKKDALGGILPLVIPRIDVDFGIFSLLAGKPSFTLNSAVFGGELRGSFSINEAAKLYRVTMRAKNLKLEQMSAIKSRFDELPVKGVMSLDTDLMMDLTTIKNSSGFLEMGITDGVMGPGKWTFELPMIRTGTFDSRFVLSDGKLEVERFEQTSPDMMSDMLGSITLSQNLQYSRVNLDYRFKIADHLLEKYDIFQLALSTIRNAEAPDGYFYHTFRGALVSMRPVANKAAQYKFRDKDRRAPAEQKPDRAVRPERPERPTPSRPPAARQEPPTGVDPESAPPAVRARPADSRRTPDARSTPRKRTRPDPPARPDDRERKRDGLAPAGMEDRVQPIAVPEPQFRAQPEPAGERYPDTAQDNEYYDELDEDLPEDDDLPEDAPEPEDYELDETSAEDDSEELEEE